MIFLEWPGGLYVVSFEGNSLSTGSVYMSDFVHPIIEHPAAKHVPRTSVLPTCPGSSRTRLQNLLCEAMCNNELHIA